MADNGIEFNINTDLHTMARVGMLEAEVVLLRDQVDFLMGLVEDYGVLEFEEVDDGT